MNILPHNSNPDEFCNSERLSRELHALAHPVRLRILSYLAQVDGCCCKDVVCQFDLAQSTISQHLKILLEAGLLEMRQQGQRSRYTPNRVALQTLALAVNRLAAELAVGGGSDGQTSNPSIQGI